MTTATKMRWRFGLANSKVIRPGVWLGHTTTNTAILSTNLQAVVDAARAEVAASGLMAGFDDTVVFEEMEAQNFQAVPFVAGPPEVETHWEATTLTFESSGADIPGTQTADSLPPQNSPCYSIRSSVPGPKGRNRMYFAPLVDTEVNALGVIDAARLTQLNADVLSVITAALAASGGGSWVVASAGPLRDPVDRSDLSAVVTAAFDNVIRSQRRRVTP